MLAGAVLSQGFLALRAMNTGGELSWMRGGFGRFDADNAVVADAQLGLDWFVGTHDEAADAGFSPLLDARSAMVELRYTRGR